MLNFNVFDANKNQNENNSKLINFSPRNCTESKSSKM